MSALKWLGHSVIKVVGYYKRSISYWQNRSGVHFRQTLLFCLLNSILLGNDRALGSNNKRKINNNEKLFRTRRHTFHQNILSKRTPTLVFNLFVTWRRSCPIPSPAVTRNLVTILSLLIWSISCKSWLIITR
jgi:hypothetical protein